MLRAAGKNKTKLALASFAVFAALVSPILVHAKGPVQTGGMATVQLAELPQQGRETFQLIRQGGPFPYAKDGSVFGNRERLLPSQNRGYYREYTVRTPGSRDRGARRLVCGGQPRTPDACYYTSDHYSSFKRVVE